MKTQMIYRQLFIASALLGSCALSLAKAPLANQPVLSSTAVPGNLALALSVEYPTVENPAHIGNTYDINATYLGYFDPKKCYAYSHSATEANQHFYPTALATAPSTCTTSTGRWSGNFLNWATMQAIDPFRWVLTGGFRSTDTAGSGTTPGVTLVQKAWAANQGGYFPNRTLSSNVSASTPFSFTNFRMRISGRGTRLVFTDGTGDPNNTPTDYTGGAATAGTVYAVTVRVKVCDPAIGSLGTAGLEENCVRYGNTYKPEGLMQKYSNRIRYSAFGYLNHSDFLRDGGVLRARQSFIGPKEPKVFTASVVNPLSEWDENTGVMVKNPAPNDATDTNTNFLLGADHIENSGVMNYLNKFGQITPGNFKAHDPVSELYYAAVRYFKNLGNVDEWTEMGSTTTATRQQWADNFPVIRTTAGNVADDPILYSCQKNFILGIGDIYTHRDKNVPGSSMVKTEEPALPGALATDPVQSTVMTNRVGKMEGMAMSGTDSILGTINPPYGSVNNSYLMAGIAFDSNTRDIRPGSTKKTKNKQTIQTYWLDVLENQVYEHKNAFWLTAKYGGFTVPNGFDPDNPPASLAPSTWHTKGSKFSPTQDLPDNYFVASKPDEVKSGLTAAFEKIASEIGGTTTGAATAQPQVLASGAASYSASFEPKDWSGEVIARKRVFGSSTPLVSIPKYWEFSKVLATQSPSSRVMVTWNGTAGVPFQHTNLTTAQVAALDTSVRPAVDDSADFLNYLRGDQTNETVAPNYRARTNLVGDIVDSSLTAVGRPILRLADYFNPGYSAFKTTWYNRKTVLYVGTNAGVLHAINAAPCTSTSAANCSTATAADIDVDAGKEIFAYVPSALFNGPSLPATPNTDGLAALANPNYVHRNYVNSTAVNFDVDLSNTVMGKSASPGSCKNPDTTNPTYWKTLLIGGLGKGGRSYYALDITNPFNASPPTTTKGPALNETDVAKKVMWEFPHPDDLAKPAYDLANKMGFSFGAPVVVKTAQHGWVVIFTSGYNNADGKGYFFIVDACSGLLVQPPIGTGSGTPTDEAGMAHATAFVLDAADGKADAAYAGDLKGDVWRLDMRATTGNFPAPERIARLRDAGGNIQPVTSRPLVELCPRTLDRFVMVGTGRLLEAIDLGDIKRQTYYAFKDGNNIVFDTLLNSTNSVVRADLVDVSDNLINSATPFTTQRGWYVEVGKTQPDLGWRVIDPSASFFGQVAFVAMLPDTTDECARGATGLLYGINFCTAKSVLLDPTSSPPGGLRPHGDPEPGKPLPPEWKNVDGTPMISTCSSSGECPPVPTTQRGATASRYLNWREIPIAE